MSERRPFQAKLTEDAADAWYDLLAATGGTFTTIIEAIGLELAEGLTPIPRRTLERARQLDVERHNRRRR